MSVNKTLKRKAFSLIELMIVIVIMGVIYTLAITSFPKKDEAQRANLSLLNLKEYLTGLQYEKSVEILCLDDCQSCDILVDGEKNATVEDFIDDSIEVYRYDYRLGPQEIVQKVYFNEDDIQDSICFSYKVDKKGVGDQVLVKFQESVYDFTSYITPTQRYSSLQDAINAKEKLVEEVLK